MAQQDRAEYFYRQVRVHVVFGVLTLSLIGLMVLVTYDDWARDWKEYQTDFREMEIARTEEERRAAEQQSADDVEAARQAMAAATQTVAEREAQIEEATGVLEKAKAKANAAKMDYQFRKAELDEQKFVYESYKNHPPGHGDAQAERAHAAELERRETKYRELEREAARLYDIQMATETAVEAAQAHVDRLTGALDEAQRALKRATADQERLGRKLKSIEKNLVNDAFRNLPLLDFINPSLTIKQVMVEGIREDLHFTNVRKIDRCQTCHMGIDKVGYEDAPQPLRTHPNLELYVSDNSPHPTFMMGCTVCHEGNGLATSFIRAAHSPRDLHQMEEWEHEYGWERLHHWDHPMHKKGNEQASCMKCHGDPEEIPIANTLLKGHTLFTTKGCYACHAIDKEPYENLRRPGPDLTHVAEKFDATWAAHWIANPWAFRPDSSMPRLFGLENMDNPEDKARDAAMVEGITRYLFEHSTPVELEEPPAEAGDAARGAELVKTVGCMACHTVNEIAAEHAGDASYRVSNFGPNLSGIGSKVGRKWLYNWVKDPKHFFPDSYMPSLRLSAAEANDVAAYLETLRDDSYLEAGFTEPSVEALDDLLVEDMKSRMPIADARARLAAMPEHDKYVLLGQKGIQTKNCFACHLIPGFENTNPVVVNFTVEGSKDKDQFNFGYIPHGHAPLHEQVEVAEHAGEPLLSFQHYTHTPAERYRPATLGDGHGLTGSATLRYPEIYGNANVPYPTDPDTAHRAVEDAYVPKERFDWIFNQIKNPQLWDRGVEQTYYNKMKMPQFGLRDDEVHALTVFVTAQVQTMIAGEFTDTADETTRAIAAGRRVAKRFNCYACHTVGLYEDAITVNLLGDRYNDGAEANVDLQRVRLWLSRDVKGHPEIFDEEGAPTGKLSDTEVTVFHKNQWLLGDLWDAEGGSYVNVATWAGYHFLEGKPLPVYGRNEGWMRQYYPDAALSPPVLYREGEKVRPDWLFAWLNNIHTIRPNLNVRMPSYALEPEEASAIVHYFAAAAGEPWPYDHTPPLPLDPEVVKLGEQVYFDTLKCNSCHPAADSMPTGQDPKQWGPNLALSQSRLKDDWITLWLRNPQGFYPGTYMPNNFFSSEEGTLVPLLGPDEQMRDYIHGIVTWVHSLDPRQAIMDYKALAAIPVETAAAPAAPADGAAATDAEGGA